MWKWDKGKLLCKIPFVGFQLFRTGVSRGIYFCFCLFVCFARALGSTIRSQPQMEIQEAEVVIIFIYCTLYPISPTLGYPSVQMQQLRDSNINYTFYKINYKFYKINYNY